MLGYWSMDITMLLMDLTILETDLDSTFLKQESRQWLMTAYSPSSWRATGTWMDQDHGSRNQSIPSLRLDLLEFKIWCSMSLKMCTNLCLMLCSNLRAFKFLHTSKKASLIILSTLEILSYACFKKRFVIPNQMEHRLVLRLTGHLNQDLDSKRIERTLSQVLESN